MSLMLRPAQIDDLRFIMDNPRCAMLSDPGVGKTCPVCVAIWWTWDELSLKSFFVMPKSLLRKNREEVLRWTKFQPDDVVILETPPKEVRQLELLLAASQHRLSWIREPDVKMCLAINGNDKLKAQTKRAKKLGWLCPEGKITPEGQAVLEHGIFTEGYFVDGGQIGNE